jgi:hypothetical protein
MRRFCVGLAALACAASVSRAQLRGLEASAPAQVVVTPGGQQEGGEGGPMGFEDAYKFLQDLVDDVAAE